MTISDERTQAVLQTGEFLVALMDPRAMPRVRRSVRQRARDLLRHYPGSYELAQTHKVFPDLWGKIPSGPKT